MMEDRIDLTAELLLAQRVADDRYEEIKALRARLDDAEEDARRLANELRCVDEARGRSGEQRCVHVARLAAAEKRAEKAEQERDALQARVDAAVAVTMRRYLPDGPEFAALVEDIAEIHRVLTRGEKGEE